MPATAGRSQSTRRAPWQHWDTLALAVVAFVPLLLTKRGLLADDTKIYLYLDPGHLVSTAISLWNKDFAFGTVTHQNIGYLFPMGPYYWVIKVLHVPVWVAQRIWMGSLLFLAALGIWKFAREIGLSRRAGWLAAWPYMLTPFILVNLDRTSALLMPWAGLGWMMLFTLRAARRADWRNPALFAIVVAMVGGVNATSIVMVAFGPLLYLVYAAHSREVSWRRAGATILKIGLLSLSVSLWWLAGLVIEGKYGIDVLKFTESFSTVSMTSTSSESLRGLGYWYFYGRDAVQPWTISSLSYMADTIVVAASFVAPVLAVVAALCVRWRYRTLAAVTAFVGVIVAVGAYPLNAPTPYGWVFKWLADHTTIALAMRSSNRVLPVVIIWLCLLVGAGYDSIRDRLPRLAHVGLVGVVGCALIGMLPLLEGKAISSNLTFPEKLPSYVVEVAGVLNAGDPNSSVLGLPGQDFAYYRYGTANDSIWPALVSRPWISSQVAPEGEPASSNLIRALDSTLQNNVAEPNSIAPIGRLFSSGDLLVQMDQQYERFSSPIPTYMWGLLTPTPKGLKLVGTYGPPAGFQAIHGPYVTEQIFGLPLNFTRPQSLAVFSIPNARSLVRSESTSSPMIVAGDGEGLVTMGSIGMLDTGAAIYYDAGLSRSAVNQLAGNPGTWLVLTDSNQKRTDTVGTLSATEGYVETADEQPLVNLPNEVRSSMFPGQSVSQQTVAVMKGLAAVGASGYGNEITNNPENQPYKAVDGNLETSWQVAAFSPAIDQYWQETAYNAQPISSIHIVQAQSATQNRYITKIGISIDGHANIVRNLDVASRSTAGQTISIPPTTGRTIRITILGDTDNDQKLAQASSVGFAEVTAKGFGPVTRGLLVPTSLLTAAGPAAAYDHLTVVLNRMRVATHPNRSDPELSLLRYFELPYPRSFTVTGYANLNPTVPDDQLNWLLGRHPGPGTSIAAVEASSRLTGSIYSAAWSAFDGDPNTGWSPAFKNGSGQWIHVKLTHATTLSNFTMTIVNDGYHMIPTSLTVSNGTTSAHVNLPITLAPQRGRLNTTQSVRVHVPAMSGTAFTFTIDTVKAVPVYDRISGGTNFPSFNIVEVAIPGVTPGVTPPEFKTGCRSDLVFINGHSLSVNVTGTTADAIAQNRLSVTPCSAAPFILNPGTQTVSSSEGAATGININTVSLDSLGSHPGPGPTSTAITANWHGRTQVDGTVPASMAGRTIVLGQSFAAGWHAILGGHDLGAPVLIDGASMGWRLPATMSAATPIVFKWEPQQYVNLAVALSALALAALILIALTGRPRRRASAVLYDVDDDEPVWGGWSASLHERPIALYATALLAALAVSLIAVPVFLVLAWLWTRRRDFGRFLAVAAAIGVAAGAAITIVASHLAFVHDITWPGHVHWANSAVWIGLSLWVLVIVGTGTSGDGGVIRRPNRPAHAPSAPTADVAATAELLSPTPDAPLSAPLVTEPEAPAPSAPSAPTRPPVPPSAVAAAGALGAEAARRRRRDEPPLEAPKAPGERRRGLNVSHSPDTGQEPEEPRTLIPPTGLRRTRFLLASGWRLRHDPEEWQSLVAQDTMSQMVGRTAIFNRRVLDISDSSVFHGPDLAERGAHVISMRPAGTAPSDDAMPTFTGEQIPAIDGQFDLVFATNILGSVPDPERLIAELVRVTRHGGTIYIQNRMWASPWGGRETSPWHLLSGKYARRRYVKKNAHEPEHRYGENLFRLSPGHAMKLLHHNDELMIFIAGPRILPTEWSWTLKVPLVRSLLVQDLVVVAERR